MSQLTLAIMSDLHCYHLGNNESTIESYLTSEKLRSPIKEHPIEALLKVIDEEKLSCDYLLCPGDVANKADRQGFLSGWNFIKEVAEALNSQNRIIATLGNHDVDSRYIGSSDIYTVAKGIKKGFPIYDHELCEKFWSHGFVFIEQELVRFLILNSVYFHTTQKEIDRGKVSLSQLDQIETYLKENVDSKMNIAMCHHHPLPHERFKLGLGDVIENGNELIDILNRYKFDLLVHGHKHDPWLRYSPGSSYTVPIFSAGSFSATTNLILTGKKNTFHLVMINKEKNSSSGKIRTWEYHPTSGWKLADSGDESFPVNSGFGYRGNLGDLIESAASIIKEFSRDGKQFIDWSHFIKMLPDVEYLTPDDCFEFRNTLRKSFNIVTYPELPKTPEIIGTLHSA